MPQPQKSPPSSARPSGQPSLTLRWQLLRQDLGEGGAFLSLALAILLIAALLGVALSAGLHWDAGFRYGGAAAILALLLLTVRRWIPTPHPPASDDAEPSSPEVEPFNPGHLSASQWSRRFLRLGLLGALVIAGYERYPRLEQSLAPHEERILPAIHGVWSQKEERQLFEATPWSATLFDMSRLGASTGLGPLAAALDRFTLETWQESKGVTPEVFNETALRLPAFLAGLFTLMVVLFLGRSMGAPGAGLTGVVLLALHPWTLRLGSEAGGASLMLLMWALYLAALSRALRQPSLSTWFKVALSGAACALCQNLGCFAVLAASVWAVGSLLRRREFRQTFTLLAFGALSAALVWVFMGPGFSAWLWSSGIPGESSDAPLTSDFLARWLTAFPAHNPFPQDHQGIQWSAWLSHPAGLVLAWALPVLTIAGVIIACRRGQEAALYVASPILAILLGASWGSPHTAVSWATLGLFPLALGATMILKAGLRKPRWLAPAALASLLITYGAATREVTQRLRDHDLQSTKDLVEFVHRQDVGSMTVSFGAQAGLPVLSYDPGLHVITQVSELSSLIETAVHEHFSLFIYVAGEREAAQQYPELAHALRHGCPTSLATGWTARFQELTPFLGLEEKWTYHIHRLSNAQEVSHP